MVDRPRMASRDIVLRAGLLRIGLVGTDQGAGAGGGAARAPGTRRKRRRDLRAQRARFRGALERPVIAIQPSEGLATGSRQVQMGDVLRRLLRRRRSPRPYP